MRKFPKAFTRRKSTANALEDLENNTSGESSFKVFDRGDRTENGSRSFDGGIKLTKPTSGPANATHNVAVEDNMFENLGNFRASGGSSSNAASLATDKSSRLSAASTTPSSTDLPGKSDEWKSPHDKPFTNIPRPPAKTIAAFSLKNAGRSLSWGRSKPSSPTTPKEANPHSKELPSVPPTDDSHSSRSRAVTASSYASTATPPKLESKDLGLSMGGDFGDMFAGFGKRKSVVMTPEPDRVVSQSPENLVPAPSQVHRFNSPAQLTIDNQKQVEEPPYSWGTQNSHDGLMANRSPPLPSASPSHPPPPVPVHGYTRPNGEIRMVGSTARPGATSTDGLRRSSALMGRRQSTLEYTSSVDEDARLLRESVNATRRLNTASPSTRVRDSWALSSSSASQSRDNSATPAWRNDDSETTPKAKQQQPRQQIGADDNMFDSQIAAAADLAARFEEAPVEPVAPPRRPDSSKRVMTPAQFERYKQDQERMRSYGVKPKEEDDDEDNYDDDAEDEAEKAKQIATQRRKQEAHMAVYRQQMMKVTGETPGLRSGIPMSQSTPNLLHVGRDDGEEEDEEIPLAILQAHGFPNKNRPPVKAMGSNPNLRASAMLGGGGGEGRLPVFARHLPQDPYYGAGLQRPMHRESMAFGGGAPPGMPPQGGPPGGLIGVIATEERSRAMRRGSPNTNGDYGPLPPNVAGLPYGGMPGDMGPMGMNPMMMTPGDHAQAQMAAQMQQFMQMQMQFMQMMTSGQGAPSIQGGPPMMPMQGENQPPISSHQLRPGSGQPSHQRAMTMMEPNAAPWMQQGGGFGAPSIRIQGYTPSIAPSERSNVGMPGRYRPVSHMPVANHDQSRLSTMSGALPNWETAKIATPTIRPVQKNGNTSDEDDEGGWEEMARKRREKKSTWKSKRDTSNFKDILNFH